MPAWASEYIDLKQALSTRQVLHPIPRAAEVPGLHLFCFLNNAAICIILQLPTACHGNTLRSHPDNQEHAMTKSVADLVNFANSNATQERYPTPAERLVKGHPEQSNTLHFEAGNRFFAGEWGAEPGCWKVKYTEDEYFHILSGKSIIRDLEGNEMLLVAGDHVCVPAGFEGEWEVLEYTRKIYVIYEEPEN
jgi:uncharacterized cupin superfamily protein